MIKARILSKDGCREVSLNRRTAIREKCLNCTGWFPSEVAECEFDDCSLFPFKLGQGKQNPRERNQAIRNYCKECCNGMLSEISLCPSTTCPLYSYRKTAR